MSHASGSSPENERVTPRCRNVNVPVLVTVAAMPTVSPTPAPVVGAAVGSTVSRAVRATNG